MASRPISCALFVLLVSLAVSCGDEPQRVGKPGSTKVPLPVGTAAASTAPTTAATVRLAGRVQLTGTLAKAQNGAVFLIARSGGRTSLVHKYDMSGPAWSVHGDDRVLQFSLTDQDNMAGVGAPVGAKLDLEARYDPDGFVDTKPDVMKPGVVKAFTSAAIGDKDVALKLDPAAPAPVSPAPPAKPSGG